MPQKAIIYARFSTSEQSKGFSLQRQTTQGEAYALTCGWEVEKTITDEGRSAFHGSNRLAGSALYDFEVEAQNGLHRGKVLIVENLDRLSRQGAKASAQLVWKLNEGGIDVATWHDGHVYKCDGDMMDHFSLIIKGALGKEESAKKSRRTAASWQRRFERIAEGTETGPIPNTPLWVDRIDGKMVLNKHRAKVLNDIFDLYIDGTGIHRIVTILHEREEPSWTPPDQRRGNNGWFYSYIYRLLTKRTVLGEYVTNDGETLSQDFWPQAITAEKWNRAQATLAMRKGNQRVTKTQGNRNLLSQMVFCATCGGGAHYHHTTATPQTYKSKSGEVRTYRRKTYRFLRCDRSRRKHSCDNPTILNYDVIEATVLDELLPRLVRKPTESDTARSLRERIAEAARQNEADQARLGNLIDALADGGSKAIVQRVAALEDQIEAQAKLIEADQKALAIETAKPATDDDVALIEATRAQLTSDDPEVRIPARGRANMTLRRLIKRILINGNGTFQIEPDEASWWLFDAEGKLIEGAYAL